MALLPPAQNIGIRTRKKLKMAKESASAFQDRIVAALRDDGFVIPGGTVQPDKMVRVRDTVVDKKPYEKSGFIKFSTSRDGSPSVIFGSHKRQMDIPDTINRGNSCFAMARGRDDKAIVRPVVEYKEPTLAEKLTLDPIYRAEMQSAVEKTKELWNSSTPVEKAGHDYLKTPAMDSARIRQTADGKLLVPVVRPAGPDLSKVELAGAQLIGNSGFKQFLPGTKAGCGFALIPSHPDPNKWLEHLAQSPKTLVLCEGVGTAMAIHQATGNPVIACLSAKNLPAVAEWLAHEGHSKNRPIVVFADNDLDKKRDGSFKQELDKYIGVKESCKAAEILGAKVALVDIDKGGYDARDLMRDSGDKAVADLVNEPRSIEQLKQDRPEAFGLQHKNEVEVEVEEPELTR